MLGSIRKFSSSIYAKILLVIVIIPFIFWGMGGSFSGGDKNIIVTIDKDKYSIEEFGNFANKYIPSKGKIDSNKVEELLSLFIGEKLIEKEVDHFNIKLSDNSLGKLIKNQKEFKRENKFSRVEYEKFLLKTNMIASAFENNLSNLEKKNQLLDFIGGGISPSDFLINETYNNINQKINIEIINLKDLFNEKINFTEDEIKSYYENEKDKYIDIHKSVKIIELNATKLTGSDEFNDLFFKKIDEIDDLIAEDANFDEIINKYNLGKPNLFTFDKSGKEINSKDILKYPEGFIKKILNLTNNNYTSMLESGNKYFIVKIENVKEVQKTIDDNIVKNDVIKNLSIKSKRKLIGEIIGKINKGDFKKSDFDQLSVKENIKIDKITLNNKNDNKILKKELVNQIYIYPEKKIIIIHDLDFYENYLVYIDKIENVVISKNSKDYEKYLDLAKTKITNELFNTYDMLVRKKYIIKINYQALETVKNYFN